LEASADSTLFFSAPSTCACAVLKVNINAKAETSTFGSKGERFMGDVRVVAKEEWMTEPMEGVDFFAQCHECRHPARFVAHGEPT
jgi:hypothetical protein